MPRPKNFMSIPMQMVLEYIEDNIAGEWFNAEDIPARICSHNALNILRGLTKRGRLESKPDPTSLLDYEKFRRVGSIA